MANNLLICLIVYFAVCALVSLYERNTAMLLYNLGAMILNIGIYIK